MRTHRTIMLMPILLSLLVACIPQVSTQDALMETKPAVEMMETQAPSPGAEAMMDKYPTPDRMQEDTSGAQKQMQVTSTADMMARTAAPMMGSETPQAVSLEAMEELLPAWFNTPFTDEVSGEAFQITDFEGKVVLVETFAQWCPTCLRQQMEMAKLPGMIGMPDDLVMLSLDVDPNEDSAMLQKYLERHDFEWRFAIAPAETAREIGDLYGLQFLNPPSAPMLVIDRQGSVHALPFGVKSVEDLAQALKGFLEEGM